MKRPIDVAVDHTLAFLEGVLPEPGSRILEVGCGGGEVAAELRAAGYRILGVESSAEAAERARAIGVDVREVDFTDFADGVFDAVLFTRSLHHIHHLDAAVRRAADLLQPGGRVICEEFDREYMDEATARWFYHQRQLLLSEADRPDAEDDDPLGRWMDEHRHDPPLHSGAAMLEAMERLFAINGTERVAYLYRYFCRELPRDSQGWRLAARLFETECRLVSAGSLRPLGRRWVALKP